MSFSHLCMKDQGGTVVLENEKISMTIDKGKTTITALHYNSKREPSKKSVNLLAGGSGYYFANVNGGSTGVGGPKMKITANVN